MTGGIFISYRREDSAAYARLVYDRVIDRFDPAFAFIDVDNIEPGRDFVKALSDRVGSCDVLLAIVGKTWTAARDGSDRSRLADPQDFVRIEIEAALKRDIRVIPVLVDGARMPAPQELPATLQPFCNRQAFEISHSRFDSDAAALVRFLEADKQLQGGLQKPGGKRRRGIALAGLLLACALLGGLWLLRGDALRSEFATAPSPAGAVSTPPVVATRASRPTPSASPTPSAEPTRSAEALAPSPAARVTPPSPPALPVATEPTPSPPAASPIARSSLPASTPMASALPQAPPSPPLAAARETPSPPPLPAATERAVEPTPPPPAASPSATARVPVPTPMASALPQAPPSPPLAAARETPPAPAAETLPALEAAPPPRAASAPEPTETGPQPLEPTPQPAASAPSGPTPAPPTEIEPTPAAEAPASPKALETVSPVATAENLTHKIEAQLQRLGCYDGVARDWTAPQMRTALQTYAHFAASPPEAPTDAWLQTLAATPTRVCPIYCPPGSFARGGRCVRPRPPHRAAAAPVHAARPASSGNCFDFNGHRVCE